MRGWWSGPRPPGLLPAGCSRMIACPICAGFKDVENRSRRTHYRGPLLIQAGSRIQSVREEVERTYGLKLPWDFQPGGIVGIVDRCQRACEIRPCQRSGDGAQVPRSTPPVPVGSKDKTAGRRHRHESGQGRRAARTRSGRNCASGQFAVDSRTRSTKS
jgi:hypothetical protein